MTTEWQDLPTLQDVAEAQAQYELGNYKQLTKEIQMENQNSNEEKLPQLRANVYDAIGTERYYQEQKWGSIEEHPQSVGGYLTLMRVHLMNAEAAWAKTDTDKDALHCLRKVLALGVACGEQHGLPKRDFNNYPE